VPAVDVLCFIGAVEAARVRPGWSNRMLPGRRDLNRCFRAPFSDVEGRIARDVLRVFESARVETLLDLHNNTGHNPPYGIGKTPDPTRLGITSLFGHRFIASTLNLGSLTEAFSDECAITIECGRAGDPSADEVARVGLVRYMLDTDLPRVDSDATEMNVYEDPLRVILRPGAHVAFAETPSEGAEITLNHDIDRHNFSVLDAKARIGWVRALGDWPIAAVGQDGRDVSRDYFAVEGRAFLTRRPFIPVMMTTSARAASDDCLFYMVKEQPRAKRRSPQARP
jgi:hypothetical protein